MLKAEQVPKAVVDAYIDAAMSQGLSFREALAAAINAWPGVERAKWTDKALILPLPHEARDE